MSRYYNAIDIDDENDLEHYGVVGMKWGIRRYQNADGSFTDRGKKRYYVGTNNRALKKAGYRNLLNDQYGEMARADMNKSISKLSPNKGHRSKRAKQALEAQQRYNETIKKAGEEGFKVTQETFIHLDPYGSTTGTWAITDHAIRDTSYKKAIDDVKNDYKNIPAKVRFWLKGK